jgi:cobyrinic acid a,c-diamide synthase
MILVGAENGGVGKTTVSRSLLDFFASRKVTTHAFDTEHPRRARAVPSRHH